MQPACGMYLRENFVNTIDVTSATVSAQSGQGMEPGSWEVASMRCRNSSPMREAPRSVGPTRSPKVSRPPNGVWCSKPTW